MPGADRSIAPTPGWTVTFAGTDRSSRHGLLAIGNGIHAVVGDLTLVAGAYGTADDGMIRPLPGPVWTSVHAPDAADIEPAGADGPATGPAPTWHLDLLRGLLHADHADGRRETRFVSITRPTIGALRVENVATGRPHPLDPAVALGEPEHDPMAARFVHRRFSRPGGSFAETISDRSTITVAVTEVESCESSRHRLDRMVAIGRIDAADDPADDPTRQLVDDLGEASLVGFDRLVDEQTDAWADRWDRAGITIERVDEDDRDQLALRFAVFHLLSCADHRGRHGETAIAARGLTGLAYAGHVFWDTEMFVLPALTAMSPRAARSALRYRERRLAAAQRRAAAAGADGARFPWESADTGDDVTPTSAPDPEGGRIEILTGRYADHIDAAVAWAAHRYATWTGDLDHLLGPGCTLLSETARWWASRARIDEHGSAHLDTVIGPDEYHELVDDNTYTDQMARWNLDTAAACCGSSTFESPAGTNDRSEADSWRDLADRFDVDRSIRDDVDARGRRFHTQFDGFEHLDPGPIDGLADRPIAADVWLGHDRIGRTQILKQPDVLMLHHVLPDWCGPGWLDADLDHYLPRTAHGSSLSPAICAGLLARADRADDALRWFDVAARLDLDDLTGSTHEGLHLATMGGLWQAVVAGFAGIRLDGDDLVVEPHLPRRWRRLEVPITVRGVHLRVVVDDSGPTIVHEGRVTGPPVRLPPMRPTTDRPERTGRTHRSGDPT